MIERRKKILGLAQEFKAICEEHKIWYSLNNETLLGIVRHGGFVPWHEKFQIFVTLDGYNTLKRVAAKHLVDSATDHNHKSLLITFVKNKANWSQADTFLEISVAVSANNQTVRKFHSKLNRFKKFLSGRKDNIKHAINDLYVPHRFEGYLKLVSRQENVRSEWIQALSFKTEQKDFNGIKFAVASEWSAILTSKFGKDFMHAATPNVWYEFPAPLKKVRVS